jgi:hypothetical protein
MKKEYSLDAIEERARKSTQGHWMIVDDKIDPKKVHLYEPDGEVSISTAAGNKETASNNALFLAHARYDILLLIDEVKRLRAITREKDK